MISKKANIRPIAVYLPQFHTIPENDAWWGKGFTEWTNVSKAKPLFRNHYQPHIPAELGFYDLNDDRVLEAQAHLAKEHGIYGFCYYHYWFNGKRLLEMPVEKMLRSGRPDFPFMLCWANENWTRTWDGGDHKILMAQHYSLDDDRAHIRTLIPYFKDPRYIRIDGKPVFAVYRSTLFPDIEETIRVWREEAAREGLELYLCRFESWGLAGKKYLRGFDAAVEFQPHLPLKENQRAQETSQYVSSLRKDFSMKNLQRSISFRGKKVYGVIMQSLKKKKPGMLKSYDEHAKAALERYSSIEDYKLFKGIAVGFDNSPRKRNKYHILVGATPDKFYHWLVNIFRNAKLTYGKDEDLFFINAWNEWGEGNHLEPCQKWGRGYLESVKKALNEFFVKNDVPQV